MIAKRYVLYIFVALVLLLVFITFLYTQFLRERPVVLSPRETPPSFKVVDPQSDKPDRATTYSVTNEAEQEELNKDAQVGKLLLRLPFNGAAFSLDYETSPYHFIVNYKGNRQAAEQAFDNFLKQNGIQNKSWLGNLTELP